MERFARVNWFARADRSEQRDEAVSVADAGCDDPTITRDGGEVDDRAKDELERSRAPVTGRNREPG